jgi:hypothetical protein
MRDSYGVSRGSGFVAFKSAEDANRAVCFLVMFCNADLIWQTHKISFLYRFLPFSLPR